MELCVVDRFSALLTLGMLLGGPPSTGKPCVVTSPIPSSPSGSGPQPNIPGLWDAPLVLAATPIGNLSDATARLRALLISADIIAAEDTRTTRHLCSALGITPQGRSLSLHEHNESSRAAELIELARQGRRIVIVADAGMPAVSDPGFRLVTAAIDAEVRVTVAPGASAVTTALALSGLPTDRFTFAGFVPRKSAERQRLVQRLATEAWTTVLFESPHRVHQTLTTLAEGLGRSRGAAVCRELTKKHEEVLRGGLGELVALTAERTLRGEIVIVVEGAIETEREETADDLAEEALHRAAAGEKLKTAAKALAQGRSVSASAIFDAALDLRDRRAD